MSNHDDLERRLRDAFEAQASQVTPEHLDRQREVETERLLRVAAPRRPRRGVLVGAGALAAAAAAAGVLAVVIPAADRGNTVDAARTVTAGTSTPGLAASDPAAGTRPEANTPHAGPGSESGSAPSANGPATGQSTPAAGSNGPGTATWGEQGYSAITPGSPTVPPQLPPGLPQSGNLAVGVDYTGPIPLRGKVTGHDATTVYQLAMPPDSTWQYVGPGGIYRVADAASVVAFWDQHLPGQGWVRSGDGWAFPGTPFSVSLAGDVVTTRNSS